MDTINSDFEKELAQLRQRLEEAEDMRRAITSGEVDAFVVGPTGNTRVLLLANAYQRYRQLVERMQQGALTASAHGQILFANQRFADMLGVPLAQLYTAPLESYVVLRDRARVSRFLMLNERESKVEVELSRSGGTVIPARMSMASFADGDATVLITDLRPLQWPSLALDALDAIRASLDKLKPAVAGDERARDAPREIAEQVDRLAWMIEEMHDVEKPAEPLA